MLDKADMDAAAAPEWARTETQSQEEKEAGRKAEAERAKEEAAREKLHKSGS